MVNVGKLHGQCGRTTWLMWVNSWLMRANSIVSGSYLCCRCGPYDGDWCGLTLVSRGNLYGK